MNDSIPVNKFTLCQTTDTVNFLVDEFPLGQTSFHFSGFFECLLLHLFFLGVFLGGNGGGVGIAWLSQPAHLGMESRAPLWRGDGAHPVPFWITDDLGRKNHLL